MSGSGVTELDHWQNDFIIPHKSVNCRSCHHFNRVMNANRGLRGSSRRQGFCVLGQLEGSFELYISSSVAHQCQSFIVDEYNTETTRLENVLGEQLSKVKMKIRDHRSRLYRQFKKFTLETQKEFDLDDKHSVWGWIEEERLVGEWFYFTHKKDYKVLHDRLAIPRTDYYAVLATIRTNLSQFIENFNAKQMTIVLGDKL